MGYATVQHVPPMRTHAQALAVYNEIKPMRGRPDVRPLGQRRDADTYSIRLNADGDVECVLYQTAVVTYKKDGDVVLYTGGWHTVSTNQFIGQLLTINVGTSRGNTIVYTGGRTNEKFVVAGHDKLTLRRSERVGHAWDVLDAKVNYGYVINRVAANNVRAKYKDFTDYMKNICKLRVPSKEYDTFEVTRQEFMAFDFGKFYYTSSETREAIMELVQSGDTEKYHEAFMRLTLESLPQWLRQRVLNDDNFIARPNVKDIRDSLKEVILRSHAKEVLDKIELPQGKLPNPKYRDWITG